MEILDRNLDRNSSGQNKLVEYNLQDEMKVDA
jgi:hypothetical protein